MNTLPDQEILWGLVMVRPCDQEIVLSLWPTQHRQCLIRSSAIDRRPRRVCTHASQSFISSSSSTLINPLGRIPSRFRDLLLWRASRLHRQGTQYKCLFHTSGLVEALCSLVRGQAELTERERMQDGMRR